MVDDPAHVARSNADYSAQITYGPRILMSGEQGGKASRA